MSEQEFIDKSFAEVFSKQKELPMALYGVGPNSKYILERFADYNIVGLLDNVRTGDTVFGQPVISLAQAKELGVRLIIIVARVNNKMIIYRRIKEFCRENNIDIYYVDGE
ncbi:MAG: hypothetical protein LBM93_14210, partial [Oscillospiraceae bacterium]|nr:hypothetical protein [Oscillospiraceae bacterium]